MAEEGEKGRGEGRERESVAGLAGKWSKEENTHEMESLARISITLLYVTSVPEIILSERCVVPMRVTRLPSSSITAPTLELKSSFMSLKQLHKTINTRSKDSGICSTK